MSTLLDGYTAELRAIDDLDESQAYKLLSNERRRAVIDALDASATPMDVDELADVVAQATSDDSERIRVDLHHVQLPMLADHGVVEYDPEAGEVSSRTAVDVSIA